MIYLSGYLVDWSGFFHVIWLLQLIRRVKLKRALVSLGLAQFASVPRNKLRECRVHFGMFRK